MELQIASAVVQEEDSPNGASGEGTAEIDESERRVDDMVESVKRGGVRFHCIGIVLTLTIAGYRALNCCVT